jgi:hypothetical protein
MEPSRTGITDFDILLEKSQLLNSRLEKRYGMIRLLCRLEMEHVT